MLPSTLQAVQLSRYFLLITALLGCSLAGMEPRDAVAFTAATQMIGVGILAPLNWLFHDRRVFVRNGSGDVLFVVMAPRCKKPLHGCPDSSTYHVLLSSMLFLSLAAGSESP